MFATIEDGERSTVCVEKKFILNLLNNFAIPFGVKELQGRDRERELSPQLLNARNG